MDAARGRHLDASAGRDVVYCHSCQHEWYQDEHGLRCPTCESEATEIVTPGPDDPRGPGIDPLADLRRFDRTPHPYHRHQHDADDSDPEEGHVDQHDNPFPGTFIHSTIFGAGNRQGNRAGGNGPSRSPNPNPTPPTPGGNGADPERNFVLRRFQEMLLNDFRMGAAGRSGRETLFPEPPPGSGPTMFQRHSTYTSGPGGVTMSFTLGGGGGGSRGASSMPLSANPFDQMLSSMMGMSPQPQSPGGPGVPSPIGAANNANQRVGQDLAAIMAALLGSFSNPNGVHGDAVYTQEAMDRILTQLMEQNQGSNAPPPASQDAMDSLPRRRLDSTMLPEGTGECTICIQDVEIGQEVVALPCSHWFHEECIMHWLREHGTCPICRQAVGGSGGTAAGSSAPPPSGSGPGPGAGAGSSQQQSQPPPRFTFFSTSASAGGRGGGDGPFGSTSQSRPVNSDRGQARLNAIRTAAGLPLQPSAGENQNSQYNYPGQPTRSRSRSPQRFSSSTAERRRRSPSSQSRRASMFPSSDRDRESNRERERDRRASYFATAGSSGNASTAGRNPNNATGTGDDSSNSGSGPFMGWLRNQFQGRRS